MSFYKYANGLPPSFQLRSLFPDKENEVRYTKLVRGYLDFDVDMENVRDFWKTAEIAMAEHAREQSRLREKQRSLRAEWERFKAAQMQMASKAEAEFNAAVQEIGAGLGSAAAAAAEGER